MRNAGFDKSKNLSESKVLHIPCRTNFVSLKSLFLIFTALCIITVLPMTAFSQTASDTCPAQSSIQINSLSAALDATRTITSGEFNITDESEGGNRPDGCSIELIDYAFDSDYKAGRRDPYEWSDPINNIFYVNGEPYSYSCSYTLVANDIDDIPVGTYLGDDLSSVTPVTFDESVTIGYTCIISNPLPDEGYLRGTAISVTFDRPDTIFHFSNDWPLNGKKGL